MVNRKTKKIQEGYALLLMLVSILGIGGVVAANFTQDARHKAEHERYLHNQRVLREAKQALLQYAYNYPRFHSEGPGRLPCPDANNNGEPGGAGGLTIASCTAVGRFPWNETELNFYDARDASGERLWYAVSSNFYNLGGGGIVNSDTTGTISIRDQSGDLMYDASQDQSDTNHQGIAAVIIAPGAVIDRAGVRQDRGIGNGDNPDDATADTDPGIIDATNYLDLFATGIDNASFVNANIDGFIMGPVENRATGVELVNDQIIIVTAAEVIEMAEKATLEAYKDAIEAYLQMSGTCSVAITSTAGTMSQRCINDGGTWTSIYPWLFNYEGITYDTGAGETVEDAIDLLSTYYPDDTAFGTSPDYHDDNGRIPSMFGSYFPTDTTSHFPIDSEIDVVIRLRIPTTGFTAVGGESIDFVTSEPFVLGFTTGLVTDVQFEDVDPGTDGDGSLTFTVDASQADKLPDDGTKDIFFWDEDEKDLPRLGQWRLCQDDGDGDSVINDCHRDASHNWNSGGANESKEEILKLIFQFDLTAGSFGFYYTSAPTITVEPADGSRHARIIATFDGADVSWWKNATSEITAFPIVSRRFWDPHYHEGTSEVLDTSDLRDVTTTGMTIESVSIGMRYHPVLPAWMLSNQWHNAIRMAYAENYRPDIKSVCNVATDDNCLKINPSDGGPRDKISLLVIAGEHGWYDGGDPDPGIGDGDLDIHDTLSVFDDGNQNGNTTYYTHRGNDRVLVIDEL